MRPESQRKRDEELVSPRCCLCWLIISWSRTRRPFSESTWHRRSDMRRLEDLLARRAKTERVTDLVNLDRVRGLLRTVYWRRRYLQMQDERRRALNEAQGIPEIVLDPAVQSPTDEGDDPFQEDGDYSLPESPISSRRSSPGPSAYLRSSQRSNSPSLRVGSPALSTRGSDAGILTSDDGRSR